MAGPLFRQLRVMFSTPDLRARTVPGSLVGLISAGTRPIDAVQSPVSLAIQQTAVVVDAGDLGLPRRSVWLVRGTTARIKTVGVDLPSQDLASRVTHLNAQPESAD